MPLFRALAKNIIEIINNTRGGTKVKLGNTTIGGQIQVPDVHSFTMSQTKKVVKDYDTLSSGDKLIVAGRGFFSLVAGFVAGRGFKSRVFFLRVFSLGS